MEGAPREVYDGFTVDYIFGVGLCIKRGDTRKRGAKFGTFLKILYIKKNPIIYNRVPIIYNQNFGKRA
jgi:hypothetical protein